MHVWLVKLEEPLPIDENYRPYRMGMLAHALLESGHSVTWWCSDLNHLSGEHRFGHDRTINVGQRLELEILNSGLRYLSPVSSLRLLDNLLLARKFGVLAKTRARPDLIVCAMPTPELAKMSSDLSLFFNVPLMLDARDFWPEIIETELKGLKKILVKPVISLMKRNLKIACGRARSLVGITPFYRDHLIRYAQRTQSDRDGVFPLGYDDTINSFDSVKAKVHSAFWRDKCGFRIEDKSVKIIYFAGRLNRTVLNAIDPVLGAAQFFLETNSKYVFILCGSGQYRNTILEKCRGLANVILPGEIAAQDLAFLRKMSYLAIQPIENRVDYENSLSNKFFEYISSRLPILTCLTGITKEIIETKEIGFFYEDSKTLINYLQRLEVDIQLRNRFAANAGKVFENEYSSSVIYPAFVKHCENLVPNHADSSR